jgi:hypothetical protein
MVSIVINMVSIAIRAAEPTLSRQRIGPRRLEESSGQGRPRIGQVAIWRPGADRVATDAPGRVKMNADGNRRPVGRLVVLAY